MRELEGIWFEFDTLQKHFIRVQVYEKIDELTPGRKQRQESVRLMMRDMHGGTHLYRTRTRNLNRNLS